MRATAHGQKPGDEGAEPVTTDTSATAGASVATGAAVLTGATITAAGTTVPTDAPVSTDTTVPTGATNIASLSPTYIIRGADFRPLLVGLRQSAGMTQSDVARLLGITQQSYAKFEAAPDRASAGRVLRVIQALGARILVTQKPTKEELMQRHVW